MLLLDAQAKLAIAQVHPDGLTLTTKRRINWRIAVLKVKNGEIDLSAGMSERLKNALAQLPQAQEFVKAL